MRPKKLEIADVEYIAFKLAQKHFEWAEPIPDFNSRFKGVLESCLSTPFQKFNKKYLYKGLIRKGAVLFYLMIKNHPFQNGNKRIAMTTLLIFLLENKKWLKCTSDKIYEFTKGVAASDPKESESVKSTIESFIREHIENAK